MKVKVAELREKVLSGVNKLGYRNEDAKIIAEVLLYAQMRGNNQGITKIATGGVPKAADVEEYKIAKQNKCGALLSGGHAMVATDKAVKLSTELAAEHGVGIVGSNHTFTSSGAIGYFARQIADLGYIGFICVGTPPFVAPFGSAEPKLGTNPLSYAFPTSGGSVVFDTATAAMAYFGVVEAKLKGEALPEGVGFDGEGNPTTDAAKALDGSVSTFAKHKGFGLSVLVQLLGGPFVDASFMGQNKEKGSGTLVMAIDPGLLTSKDEFMQGADELAKQLKSAKPLSGDGVLLPGERGDNLAKQAEKSGEIEIADAIWNELNAFVEG
ncbi:MAG TPA: Ldh family oxidoreductase [Candidatus Saccharimonadales bacterium]|nr:Ldh family oxidoreductase [Candidatus Saccharimonadales bacterium]